MAVRAISGIAIVDANVTDISTEVVKADKANQLDVVYLGNGKVMVVEATKT